MGTECGPVSPLCTTYPVEIFKMKLFEDGVSAFQFIPPYRSQIWQQLVPLLSTQPVCLASLGEGEQKPQGVPFIGQEHAPDFGGGI